MGRKAEGCKGFWCFFESKWGAKDLAALQDEVGTEVTEDGERAEALNEYFTGKNVGRCAS